MLCTTAAEFAASGTCAGSRVFHGPLRAKPFVGRNPDPASPPGALTYLTAVLIAVPLVVRRRYPLGVLLACAVLLFAFYSVNPHSGMGPAVPLAVALYTGAEYGHLRWSLGVSAFYVGVGIFV